MIRSILFFLSFILFHFSYSQIDTISKKNNSINIKKLYGYALQGNVLKIINELDSIPDELLTDEQKNLKQKYMHRFVKEDEVFDFKTKDTSLIQIMKICQSYWKALLLNKKSKEQAEQQLENQLGDYIHFIQHKKKREKKIYEDCLFYTEKLIKYNHHYCANGITAGIFDLLVWDKEIKIKYDVQLPEESVKVTIIFMDDIITMGWEEYATLGKHYPGGWATDKSLYCVKNVYDTTSEKFKISYLQHEGQHFADYKSYPHLSGADLEYRAKLTELSNLNKNIYSIIEFFITNASTKNRNDSHSFADYFIIRDLSKELFKEEFVSNIEQWKKIPYQDINKASEKLLKQNSENLKKVGRKKVVEFIN